MVRQTPLLRQNLPLCLRVIDRSVVWQNDKYVSLHFVVVSIDKWPVLYLSTHAGEKMVQVRVYTKRIPVENSLCCCSLLLTKFAFKLLPICIIWNFSTTGIVWVAGFYYLLRSVGCCVFYIVSIKLVNIKYVTDHAHHQSLFYSQN